MFFFTFIGNETVVDLYLYEDTKDFASAEIHPELIETSAAIKQEVKDEQITSDPSCEHDYYTSDTELLVEIDAKTENLDCIQLDHTYCLPNSSDSNETNLLHGITNQEEDENKTTEEIICDFKSDLLINGNSVFKNTSIKQLIPKLLSKDTHVKILKITGKDGKTLIINKNDSGIQNTIIDYLKYKICIPVEKFNNVLEVLPFLFRRLPLVSNLASNLSYKCRYPYVANSLSEFLSWNIGKRLSSEVRPFALRS